MSLFEISNCSKFGEHRVKVTSTILVGISNTVHPDYIGIIWHTETVTSLTPFAIVGKVGCIVDGMCFYAFPPTIYMVDWYIVTLCTCAAICWDQWFPESARAMALMGAELLFFPTAIGTEPQDGDLDSSGHWRRVMQGHAGANLVCVMLPASAFIKLSSLK